MACQARDCHRSAANQGYIGLVREKTLYIVVGKLVRASAPGELQGGLVDIGVFNAR
jgi:hypothetical protein